MGGRWFYVGIWEKTKTPDGQGGSSITWGLLTSAWAQVSPLKSYEKLQYEKLDSKIDHRLVFRIPIDIKDGQHVIVRGRTFEVKSPPKNIGERDQYQEVMAREIF